MQDMPNMQKLESYLKAAGMNTEWRACQTLSELENRIAQMDILVASRYHAAVLAIRCGVPMMALGSENKIRALMKDIGLPEAFLGIDVEGKSIEELREAIKKMT